MRNLLGGKGAGLAEMANLGLPVPPGFTITTDGLHALLRERQDLSEGPAGAGRAPRSPQVGRITGKSLRRQAKPAAGLGALGGARVDAGHDGHRAQSRPQRRDRRGAGEELRRQALRLRLLSPLHHDVFRRRARHRIIITSRRSSTTTRTDNGYTLDTDLDGRRLGRAGRAATRSGSRRSTARRSRRTRTSSSGAQSAPCSAPG